MILVDEELGIGIRNSGRYAFESRLSHGIEIGEVVAVEVFAADDAGPVHRVRLAQPGDVDVETVCRVDPPRIYRVHAIALHPLPGHGVDIEKVLPANNMLVGRRGIAGRTEPVAGLVVMVSNVGQCRARNLCVDVQIPGQYG
jgi:hypothetical protein